MNKKIDMNPEYNADICRGNGGKDDGCHYHKDSCVCNYRAKYKPENGVQLPKQTTGTSDDKAGK